MSYMSQIGMMTDTALTGKLYPKLDAVVETKSDGEVFYFYLGSSCQFKTQRRYKQWILEHKSFGEASKLIIQKGKE